MSTQNTDGLEKDNNDFRLGLLLDLENTRKVMSISSDDDIPPYDVVTILIEGLYAYRYENNDGS